MKLTEHFTLEEMTHSQSADRLGLDNTPNGGEVAELRKTCELLELIRAIINLGRPEEDREYGIIVTSGYRSPAVNDDVGGAVNSAHMRGAAADIISPRFGNPLQLAERIRDAGITFGKLILEFYDPDTGRGWVHVQTGNQRIVLTKNASRDYEPGLWE